MGACCAKTIEFSEEQVKLVGDSNGISTTPIILIDESNITELSKSAILIQSQYRGMKSRREVYCI